jgi:hypothetical protein
MPWRFNVLGATTKAKENADVRRVLAPLVKLIKEFGVLVIANNHLNKSAGKALYRVLDSIKTFVAVGRIVHLDIKDADNSEHQQERRQWRQMAAQPRELNEYSDH